MRIQIASLILAAGVCLAACAPAAPQPDGGLVTQPEADQWADAPQAALNARADLAQHLNVDVDSIGLVSVEKVNWSDSCLGIQAAGVMCMQVITPGYKIILAAGGQEYEYHTNANGKRVQLVAAQF